MRVLLATDWPGAGGGVENYLTIVAGALFALGDEVRLLTSSVGAGAAVAQYLAPGSRHPLAQSVLQIANPAAARTMRRAVREFRPDVVHVSMFEMHLSPSVLTAAAREVPVVANIAYYKPICPNALKLRVDDSICTVPRGVVCWRGGCLSFPHWLRDQARYQRIDRVLAGRPMVTCSRWMQQQLAEAGLAARWHPWPVAQPSPSFRRRPSGSPQFVVAGRLAREKGIETLLRAIAAASYPGLRLRVIGDGPLRPALERLADTLGVGDAVDFTGWVAPEEVEPLMSDAWALVAPSRWAEPLGMTAIEAVVRGIPVIASATGGLAETVIEGVSGLLVPNGNVEALAERLVAVASRQALAGGVPDETVVAMRERHDPARHARWLHDLLAEVAA